MNDDGQRHYALSIDALQFGILSPDEIRAYSVCEVRDPQQFENGRPVAHGPFDLRMGSITRQLVCATCHRDKETCPGHFGHIELQVPVLHPFFAEQVKEILNCVCGYCSELLVVKDEAFLSAVRAKTNPKTRAAFVYDIVAKKNVRVCGYCGFARPQQQQQQQQQRPEQPPPSLQQQQQPRLEQKGGERQDASSALSPMLTTKNRRRNSATMPSVRRNSALIGAPATATANRLKRVHFNIGRGKYRLSKKPPPTRLADVVQGSGTLFSSSTLTDFVVEPQTLPTFEQLTVSTADKASLDTAPNSTLRTACFTIQPRILYENTNLYMLWPEAPQIYSFLLNGTTEEEDDDKEEKEKAERQEHERAIVGGAATANDADVTYVDDGKAADGEYADDGQVVDDRRRTGGGGGKKRKLAAATMAMTPVDGERKKRRKKIKDATLLDVQRLLCNSVFHLPPSAKPGERELLGAKQAHDILCRISPENCYLLGYDPLYSHPSWFIITVLPVLPPCARPLADMTRNTGSHIPLDDISFKLIQLVKKNNDLAKQKSYRDANYANYQTLVTHHVMTLIDNKLRGQPVARRSPKAPPLESLSSGLKGKEGRVRGTMLGKRVDFSARGVVGPSDELRSDQLGVPAKVARSLTIPETVNRLNIDALQACVDRGPRAHRDGANYVRTADGVRYNLAVRRHIALRVGYVVERHLRDNDIVVFNRQPSLHRMSMMGHRAKIHDGDNFRLNLSVTTPYNADFDGDEMNCHAVQSTVGRVEVSELMMVPSQFISPQNCTPIISVIQDVLLAARLFTKRDTFLTRAEMFQLLMVLRHADDCAETVAMFERKLPHNRLPMPAIVRPVALWSGKQFFSLLLPEDLRYERRSRAYSQFKEALKPLQNSDPQTATFCDPSDTMTIVRRGQLLCGNVDKKSIGLSGGSFVHIVVNDHGGQRARDMIDAVARCMTSWLRDRGFSVGIRDMVLDPAQRRHIASIKQAARDTAEQLSRDYVARRIDEMPGKTMAEAFESKVNTTLNKCRDEIGLYVQQSLPLGNCMKEMESAGSKGNLTNAASICGGIGQNNVNGRRLEPVYYGRSTPHAVPSDASDIEGRGFIGGCYLDGLRPLEFFGHHMGGREGLVHTAVKTSETGYIQRRLINILADLTVSYESHSVRNATGDIVQFAYGEDTMDATRLEQQPCELLKYDNATMLRYYYVGGPLSAEQLQQHVLPRVRLDACRAILESCSIPLPTTPQDAAAAPLTTTDTDEALTEMRFLFEARDYLRHSVFRGEPRDYLYLPKNLQRLIGRAQDRFPLGNDGRVPLQLADASAIRTLLGSLLDRMMDSKNGPLNRACDSTSNGACDGVDAQRPSLYARYRDASLTQPTALETDNNTFNNHLSGVPHTELLAAIFVHYCLSPKRVVEQHRLSLEALRWVCDEYAREFFASRIHAGEASGLVAAQSLGEPSTQLTLDVFHLAGVNDVDVTLGLPRLKELTAAAKNIQKPTMSVYLSPQWRGAAGENNIARKIATSLPLVLLENLLLHSETLCDARADDAGVAQHSAFPETSIERDRAFLAAACAADPHLCEQSGTLSPWCIRFVLNREALIERQYSTTFVAAVLRRHAADWACVVGSDDNDCGVVDLQSSVANGDRNVGCDGGVIRIYLLANPMQKELDWQKPDRDGLLDPTALDSVTDAQWQYACCEQYADQALQFCTTLKIGGTDGIVGAVPRQVAITEYCADTGRVVDGAQEWTINTQGSNLADVLTMQGVDATRTICNHAIEVQKVLGIEAARQVLLDQFRKVLQSSDAHVDYRHLALLVDTMTAGGQITPVSRHAFRKQLTGPYTRAAFEQQADVLCDAAMYAEFEDGNDMRSAIMMGKRIPQGTGTMFDTLLSLQSIVETPSKSLQQIQEQRAAAAAPKNPFGFTGIRPTTAAATTTGGEKPNRDRLGGEMLPVVRNPFYSGSFKEPRCDDEWASEFTDELAAQRPEKRSRVAAEQRPLLSETVFEKAAHAAHVEYQHRQATSALAAYRPRSPSMFFS